MFNLSALEIVVIVVVAILVFGPRLPQVAAEFAGWLVKLKRSLTDLRRESGIDREFDQIRREVDSAVPRELRTLDVARSVEGGVARVKRDVAGPVVEAFESIQESALKDRREPLPPAEPPVTPADSDPAAPTEATDPLR